MKFTSILSNLIVEQSRFEVLYDKFVKPKGESEQGRPKKGIIDFDTLKKIIFADPTTRVPEGFNVNTTDYKQMDSVRVGKYVQWLLKNFILPKVTDLDLPEDTDVNSPEYKSARKEYMSFFLEDLYKVTDDLRKFERAKIYLPVEQRDINKFTVKSLFNTLENFVIPEKKKAEVEKKEAKKSREGFKHAGGTIVHEGPEWTVIKDFGGSNSTN